MELFDSERAGALRRGRIRYLPAVPGRMEFASAVREEILREPPSVVAVELPITLEPLYSRAIERLPQLSALTWRDRGDDRAVYVPIEPSDCFVEALRTARELGLTVEFLDPDTSERPHLDEIYPDVYAVERLGLARYVEAYRLGRPEPSREVRVHAEGLAWRMQGCDPEAEILVVVSLNLLDALLEAMERPQAQPLRKLRREQPRLLNLHPECLAEVLTDPPFLQAVYEARRRGGLDDSAPRVDRVQQTAVGFELIERPKTDPREEALREAAQEGLGRPQVHLRLFGVAETLYERNAGETLAHWQRRLWARYSRNLALVQNQLLPSLFDMTVAARSIVDDNFAWELWEAAGWYPHQRIDSDLMNVKISGEEMFLDTRRIQLRRRFRSKKGRARPLGLRGRKRETEPGEWKKQWKGGGICSYPPEDLRIEEYGFYLKSKGKGLLSEERSRVEPFTTSLRDGIDLRETLRNWHDGRKIYVRENQRVQGDVGAVVLIFDEDRDNRYPYAITWLGESQNESDMAFYATDPFENVVGPGIGRAEYGGLMLMLPSQRMGDVWRDPDYSFAESKPERLLLAALDYSQEKIIVYAAPKPPRSIFKSIAARIGRQIVYIPLGQLSPPTLKKLRVMHVLDGHERRTSAGEYLW
ncbi:MAG: hypothetical protein GC160_27910 [Acidobacteria bacterium]|nr:hypothetical protein [Acidobacteriota bacterium]